MKSVQAATPRLSDEDPDPLEQDEMDNSSTNQMEGWLPWDLEDILDIRRLIDNKMPPKQKQVFVAFLNGQSYNNIHVTEKYWRYHFAKGLEFIKRELKL
jgi:hypothetical protein